MAVKTRHRATSDLQKEQRRDVILAAAHDLIRDVGFFDVSMSMISKRAGVAKGTIYIYFETKEEIFLSLSLDELRSWLTQLMNELSDINKPVSNDQFLQIVRRTLSERQSLYSLISLMHLILEKNVSFKQALNFKRTLLSLMMDVSGLIEAALPYLAKGDGVKLLTQLHCLLLGWSQMTEVSPVMDQVLAEPDLQVFRFDLEDALFDSMSTLLAGLEAKSKLQPQE